MEGSVTYKQGTKYYSGLNAVILAYPYTYQHMLDTREVIIGRPSIPWAMKLMMDNTGRYYLEEK